MGVLTGPTHNVHMCHLCFQVLWNSNGNFLDIYEITPTAR